LGWTYTMAWSLSFWPQAILNWRRKSVQGLSKDFLYLNVAGFLCYTTFNVGLLYSNTVREEYASRHHGHLPAVRFNDVVFAANALTMATFTLCQFELFHYKRDPNQILSATVIITLVIIISSTLISLFLTLIHQSTSLDLLNFLASWKLFTSFVKYVPQANLNFRRKSTIGWSIENIILDATGGILSISQVILDAGLNNDWSAIVGDAPKVILGGLSLSFDIIFISQHFWFYRGAKDVDESVREREPLLNSGDPSV